MLAVLSPAKKMNETRSTPLALSAPRLDRDARELIPVAEALSTAELKSLMKLSDALAELNTSRFTDFESQAEHPAALLFDGDTYWGLDAKSLDADALREADGRLRILSGLYGLLRPLDRVRPYRLEMGTKLANPRGADLYQFWGTAIADALREDMAGHEEEAVLNLASREYSSAIDRAALDRPVVTATFLQVRDGEARNLGMFAKRARGQLARWVVDNRVDRVEGAKDFAYGGYGFDAGRSTAEEYVFTRAQPEPKSKAKR